MAPLLHWKIFLTFLRFARDYTKRCLGRLALLLAFLGRKFSQRWHSRRPGKPGTSQTLKPVPRPGDPSFLGNSYSVSGGPTIVKQYTVAASSVPVSASLPSLHESVERQPVTAALITDTSVSIPPAIPDIPVEHSHGHDPPRPLGGRGPVNRGSGDPSAANILSQGRASHGVRFSVITTSRDSHRATHGQPSRLSREAHLNRRSMSMASVQSRASDRLSVITTSSIRASPGQLSRRPRAVHRQFGRGPDPSRSGERPTRPATPLSPPHTPIFLPNLELITTNLPSAGHESSGVGPVVPPSLSPAYKHEPLGSSPMNEARRRPSLTSFIVDVQNPSTESLPTTPFATGPPLTEEPLAMESATAHSPPDSPVVDQHDEPVPDSPTFSDAEVLDYYLPDGRFVQLINSDQIPRYTKDVLMQVEYII